MPSFGHLVLVFIAFFWVKKLPRPRYPQAAGHIANVLRAKSVQSEKLLTQKNYSVDPRRSSCV